MSLTFFFIKVTTKHDLKLNDAGDSLITNIYKIFY